MDILPAKIKFAPSTVQGRGNIAEFDSINAPSRASDWSTRFLCCVVTRSVSWQLGSHRSLGVELFKKHRLLSNVYGDITAQLPFYF